MIRGLIKLPENKRCVNCNHLAPGYVCTSFWTFVCTVCSGVHREFGHRVKSVSMSSFTSEEVIALQAGGNERARKIYLEAWDAERNPHPEGGDINGIRDFIKHVYVDKRYTGRRGLNMHPTEKSGDKGNFYERHPIEKSGLSSREDFYERRYHERSSPSGRGERDYRDYTDGRSTRNYINDTDYGKYFEGSSPHSIYERFGSHKSRSAARFEIVDNRIRDDRYGRRRAESLKISSTDTKMSPVPQRREDKADPTPLETQRDGRYGKRSESLKISSTNTRMSSEPQRREEKADPVVVEPQKTRKKANPPVLRPLREIMREITKNKNSSDSTKANKAKTTKANKAKDADNAAYFQKTVISDICDSADVTQHEKLVTSASGLIDFENNLESPDSAKTRTESGSSIQSSTVQKTSNPPIVNSMEYLLFELSVAPVRNASENPITNTASSTACNTWITTPVASLTEPPASSVVPTASAPANIASSTAPEASSSVASNTQIASTPKKTASRFAETAVASSFVGNAQTLPFSSADSVSWVAKEQKVQTTQQHQPSASSAENNSSTGPQGTPTFKALFDQPWPSLPEPTTQEAPSIASANKSSQAISKETQTTISPENGSKSTGRIELPAELFSFSYPTYPTPMHNWQTHPPHGMAYGMQYAPLPNVAAFTTAAKSRNPFDNEEDSRPGQGAMLPSTASIQGALPQMSPLAGMQPQPSPFASGLPPESPSYGMYMPPGGYMGQQMPNHTPSQSFNGGSGFASFNQTQHYPGGYSSNSALGASNSFPSNSFPSAGRNPFA